MSSSSESEGKVPIKKVKRRHAHRVTGIDAERQKVNLYSHKILPKLDALQKSPIKIPQDDEGIDYTPFIATPEKSSPEVKVTDPDPSSPLRSPADPAKVADPTPPPPFNPKKRSRRGGKARKLLQEVTSVLSQLDSPNDSIVLVDESNDIVREIMVKIRHRGRLQKFPTEEDKSFEEIFDKLAKKFKVDSSRLLITFGDRRVFPADTPAGIQLTIADILECVIAQRRLDPGVKDTIKIQMQGPFQKKKVPFIMGQTETFQAVMEEYAKNNKTSLDLLQFRFDGDLLLPSSTPKSLALDNGDCIDVMSLSNG